LVAHVNRRYAASAAKRVMFIKRAQELGFTLEEVCAAPDLRAAGWAVRTPASRLRDQIFNTPFRIAENYGIYFA